MSGERITSAGVQRLRAGLRQEEDAAADFPKRDGSNDPLEWLPCTDPSGLPPAICQGRQVAVSVGGDAAHPLAAAVVHAVGSVDGGDADRHPLFPALSGDRRPCQLLIAISLGQRRALPDTAEGRFENLFEAAKAHLRANVEHPFQVIKYQFGFQKTRYRGIKKNDHNLRMLFALANLYKIR